MKKLTHIFLLVCVLGLLCPQMAPAQETCEPNYSVPYQTVNGVMAPGEMSNKQFSTMMTVGVPFNTTATNYSKNSVVMGYWSTYLKEPRPPLVLASDGDHQDMVLVQWTVEGGRTGPPVTGQGVKLYRNGHILTTLPLSQTEYLDFNVFPGEYYNYGVTSSNAMGESHTDNNIGFLNPNGVITGHVETPSGNPVIDTKVLLTPNLGLSAFFDGSSYIYYFDSRTSANRLFSGLKGDYTIETWFRSINKQQQTIFSAVDSATADIYILLEITENGSIRWQHSPEAGGDGTQIVTVRDFTKDSKWHHLAVVFNQNEMTMYIDAAIMGTETADGPVNDDVEIILGKRSPQTNSNYLLGRLDDFRIWSTPRSWEDLRKFINITLSGDEEKLAAYWKFDEVEGDIIFDLTTNNLDGSICHITRDKLTAPVFVGAITDSVGNYSIKNIYYAGGTTFTVSPGKQTVIGRSLKFDGVDDFIGFKNQRINLLGGYTVEGWFKTRAENSQTILAAINPADGSHRFKIEVTSSGKVKGSHFGVAISSAKAYNDELWHHFAATYDSSNFAIYVDGALQGAAAMSQSIPDLSEFVIARRGPEVSEDYFQGYLDEIRVWNSGRTAAQVGGTMNQVLKGDEFGLLNYWRLNEGSDELVNDDLGNVNAGVLQGAKWSEDIPLNEVFTHIYEPESRRATLNHSVTSVDRIDFTDNSRIAISGYVRYENSACFQQNVEMQINGESLWPPIYTNADGKFVLELEPGRRGDLLTCTFKDHEFVPGYIELPMITRPITGLYFNDKAKHDVSGKVAGGKNEYPITPSQGEIKVTFTTVSGCFDTTIVPNPNTGMFEIKGLPPLIYNVTIDHPDPKIDAFFTGDTISLEDGNREVKFIYRSLPQVAISGFPENECGIRVMEMLKEYTLTCDIFETYINYATGDTNTSVVDSGMVKVGNLISDSNPDTTYTFTNGKFTYKLKAGAPNILSGGEHPYQKNIQATITDNLKRQATAEEWTIVTGNRPRETFYATTSPEVPLMILHAPPGDGSSAYWEAGTTIEQSMGLAMADANNIGGYVVAHLGPKMTTSIGFIASVDFEVETQLDFTTSASVGIKNSTFTEQAWSFSTSEKMSTTTGGDVFIGGAINFLYGITDVLRIEDCEVVIEKKPIFVPNGFATNYVYSEKYINDVVIPSLLTINDTTSANTWKRYLAKNETNKNAASYVENRSFDAGTVYEFSATNTLTETSAWDFEMEVNAEFAMDAGIKINGVGAGGGLKVSTQMTTGLSTVESKTTANTFGYTLADDDIGDAFTLDILKDGTYGSPVFKVVSGASSCPWEHGTVPYDMPSLSISPAFKTNVPPDEDAVFDLSIGNLSQMDASREYWLRVINTTNPFGAVIKINGVVMEDHMSYFVPAGQAVNTVLSVGRGPEKFEYNNIQLQLVSPCQYAWWQNGFNLELADTVSFSVQYQIPASKVKISTPEDAWVVTGQTESDTIWVTVNEYDRENPNLESIVLKYREAPSADNTASVPGGDPKSMNGKTANLHASISAEDSENTDVLDPRANSPDDSTQNITGAAVNDWFIIKTIPVDSLKDDYVLIPWNISPSILVDGFYSLQAEARCYGTTLSGKSNVVTGTIDRTAPKILGAQSPTDGILHPDDEISITFNEKINPARLNVGNGDIKLFNTVTSEAIDFTHTASAEKIVIDPQIQNHFIENQTLRAEVKNIEDVYGNLSTETFTWEFFVNRNPVEWAGGGINDVVIFIDETFSTTRQLQNIGGSNRSWEIIGGRAGATAESPALNLPAWLEVTPLSGTLTPGNKTTISLSLKDDLDFGEYQTTIYAAGVLGDEPLEIDIRKLHYPPEWSVDPSKYQYTMTITATLAIDSSLSDDVYDLVGVFVDDEVRGVGNVQYIPAFKNLPNTFPYEVFLTIYSNSSSGEDLEFRVWDASSARELRRVMEEYKFMPNMQYGTPTSPVMITASSQVLSKIDLPSGWKWFSLNLTETDMSVNHILQSLTPSDGDLLKSQTTFDQYVTNFGWVGTLPALNTKAAYMLRLAKTDTLELIGFPTDVEKDTIGIVTGWNWIGYTPQNSIEVNSALGSLKAAATGDILKSQFKYAQFVENLGWIGSLQYMTPKQGYLLNAMRPGKLLYPFYPNAGDNSLAKSAKETLASNPVDWMINPSEFQFNMTVTCIVNFNGIEADSVGDVLAAFSGNLDAPEEMLECRGWAQPIFIPQLNRYLFFLMVYSNQVNGENIQFRFYDSNDAVKYYVPHVIVFKADDSYGSVEIPYEFIARELGIGDPGFIPESFSITDNYPNPFNPLTRIGYGIAEDCHVRIQVYNVLGELVKTLVSGHQSAGYRYAIWDGTNETGLPVASGVYLIRIKAGDPAKGSKHGLQTVRKMTLMK